MEKLVINQIESIRNNFPRIFKKKIFWLGIILKIIVILFSISNLRFDLFLPFLSSFDSQYLFDPWTSHINNTGINNAFPYGTTMYLFYKIPILVFNYLFNNSLSTLINNYIIGFTTLVIDVSILFILSETLSNKNKKYDNYLLYFYWLSPVILYSSYYHGQLDLLPSGLLCLSLYFLDKEKYSLSGFSIGMAFTAKFNILISFPFLIIYIYKRWYEKYRLFWFLSFFISTSISQLFYSLFSEGYRNTVLGTPEVNKLFTLSINYGQNTNLYLIPIVYVFSIYLFWKLTRPGKDLIWTSLAISFIPIYVLLPPSPGWVIWLLPFLVYYLCLQKSSGIDILLYYSFSILFLVFFALQDLNLDSIKDVCFNQFFLNLFCDNLLDFDKNKILSLTFSLESVCLLILGYRIFNYGLIRNSLYKGSNTPVLINIKSSLENKKYIKSLSCSLRKILGFGFTEYIDAFNYKRTINKFSNKQKIDKKQFINDLISKFRNNNNFNIKNLYQNQQQSFEFLSLRKPKYLIVISDFNVDFISPYFNESIEININDERSKEYNSKNNFDRKVFVNCDIDKIDNNLSISKINLDLYDDLLYESFERGLISICNSSVESLQNSNDFYRNFLIFGNFFKDDIKSLSKYLIYSSRDLIYSESWDDGIQGIIELIIIIEISILLKSKISKMVLNI